MAEISVLIQMGSYPSPQDKYEIINIDSFMHRDFQAIDFAALGADATVAAIFCTAPEQRDRQIRNREEFAKYCANELTKRILKHFSFADTEMGYSKKENDRFYNGK